MKRSVRYGSRSFLAAVVVLFAVGLLVGPVLSDEAVAQLRPAIVKDVENPDKQAIYTQYNLSVTIEAGSRTHSTVSDAVPAGKRWVIEHVSAEASMPTSGQAPFVRFNSTGSDFVHYLPMTYQGGDFGTVSYQYVWVGSQAMKLRLNPGSTILIEFRRTEVDLGAAAHLIIHFSGYLVDYP